MRDLDVIASELRLLAAVRRTAAEVGAPAPRIGAPVDELLNEYWPASAVAAGNQPENSSIFVFFDLQWARERCP